MENNYRNILIVEDDDRIARILDVYLTRESFITTVLGESHQVLPQVRKNPPDLILLDILLPGKDGLTIFKEIKSFSNVPILFITAKTDTYDRLIGLELGADDYICKPFVPKEVVARVKAVLRRTYPEQPIEKLKVGPLYMDVEQHKVKIRRTELHLTPNQFKLLRCLMTQPDCVVPRSSLVIKIHGYNFDGYNRTIDTHIKNLRKIIHRHLPGHDLIRSVYGVGYSLITPEDT